jgi:uncharacterized protein
MRADLVRARLDRDQVAVSALRTTLAAMANAEAPPAPPVPAREPPTHRPDVDRLELSDDDRRAIVAAEIADRRQTMAVYERHDRPAEAAELARQIEVLEAYLR